MLFPGPYYVIKGLYFVFSQYCVVSVFITLHILLLPLRFTAPALYWKIDALLFKASLGLVSSWFYTEGVTLKESGDSLKDIYSDEVLLLCNHQSTADIGVMMQSMYSKGPTAGHLIWIMDHVFRLTHFGWMSCFHGDFFLEKPRTEAKRNEQMRNMKEHIRSAYSDGMKKWVVLFPEGGFLCNMRPSSQRYANQHGLPILNNVCLPRLVATQTIIDELTPKEGSHHLDLEDSQSIVPPT
ncbi:acyl-CoA:lysophosphatidylglycerol acyltransferase 1 isoform X2 [Magallana gigas]|uniref:acyl-CoA:lysophosphatidylglycerol acyltransferase 1 isoform X2 n=1 Tax=Magallana gigas TaxID=29159 RepID=UPI0033405ADE